MKLPSGPEVARCVLDRNRKWEFENVRILVSSEATIPAPAIGRPSTSASVPRIFPVAGAWATQDFQDCSTARLISSENSAVSREIGSTAAAFGPRSRRTSSSISPPRAILRTIPSRSTRKLETSLCIPKAVRVFP